MQLTLIISLLIAAGAVLFAIQNNQPVTVKFLVWSVESSSAMVIILSVLAGVLISLFASLPSIGKDKWTLRGHRKKVSELEASLADTQAQLDQAQVKNAELESALAQAKADPAASIEAPADPGEG